MGRRGLSFRVACGGLVPLIFALDLSGCAGPGKASRSLSAPPDASLEDAARGRLAAARLVRGYEVEFRTRSGRRVHGRFVGVERMSDSLYAVHVDSVWASVPEDERAPAPGSRVTVRPRRGKPWSGSLTGYAIGAVEVLRDGTDSPRTLRLDDFHDVEPEDGRAWTPAALDDAAEAGRLPAFSVMVVDLYGERRTVNADEVDEVAYRQANGDWVVGFLVFTGVVAIILVIAAATSQPEPSGCTYSGDWPGLYLRHRLSVSSSSPR